MGYSGEFEGIEFDLGIKTLERWLIKPEKKINIALGIPKERANDERRVALSPAGVKILNENGVRVLIEKHAGLASNFSDEEYAEAGGHLTDSPEALYENANVIVKVAPPRQEEAPLFKPNQLLISALHLGSVSPRLTQVLLEKNITAIGFEFIETRDGELPIVRTLSEIAGSLAIQTAAKYL
ncbi:MAG: alanine dehydrogenase, partial [Chlorobium sp.]|nr:alanine dehydrogenase [Chlorobium sp.]